LEIWEEKKGRQKGQTVLKKGRTKLKTPAVCHDHAKLYGGKLLAELGRYQH
jgi:hypothetical protein